VAALAARAAGGIASACLAIGQQRVVAVLRQRLIPSVPCAPAGIEVAARCLPAPGQVSSGDWYDILALPGGRAGLIAGDAMGHDQQAAAAMTQLRAVAHALSDLDLPAPPRR
jgi:serine phosphatase RsbU (regulator of sigma subunit)